MQLSNEMITEDKLNEIQLADWLSQLCTFLLMFSICIRSHIWLKWAITVQKYTTYDTLINTGMWKGMIFEIVINSISPIPLLKGLKYKETVKDWGAEIEYEVNDILLVFMFARIYLVIKFILFMTQF